MPAVHRLKRNLIPSRTPLQGSTSASNTPALNGNFLEQILAHVSAEGRSSTSRHQGWTSASIYSRSARRRLCAPLVWNDSAAAFGVRLCCGAAVQRCAARCLQGARSGGEIVSPPRGAAATQGNARRCVVIGKHEAGAAQRGAELQRTAVRTYS